MFHERSFLLLTLIFSLLLVAPLPLVAQDACTPATGDPLTIGALFPAANILMGSTAETLQGAEAMRQAVNACGGVNGQPVEFALESANDRDDAEAAIARLTAQGVPVIIGSGLPAVYEGAAAVVAQQVVYWEVTESIAPSSAWLFTSAPTDEQLGAAAAAFVGQHLGGMPLRAALVYEGRRRGEETARSVESSALADHLVMSYRYEDQLADPQALATEMKRLGVNVILVSAFESDALNLWFAVRQADIPLSAWVQIGSESYLSRLCAYRISGDGVITVNRVGARSVAHQQETIGALYREYETAYVRDYTITPPPLADLSASGVYLLLREVLPRITGDMTPASVREVLGRIHEERVLGLMGESLDFSAGGINLGASPVISQQQGENVCSLSPADGATCIAPISFPTWRERAIQEANTLTCNVDV